MSLYLLSRGITGNRFVQYCSLYLIFASIALTVALGSAGAMSWDGAMISAVCSIPIFVGMWMGRRVRASIPEALARKLVLGMVVLGGLIMVDLPLSAVFSTSARPMVGSPSWTIEARDRCRSQRNCHEARRPPQPEDRPRPAVVEPDGAG
jgi:hypothetical protein